MSPLTTFGFLHAALYYPALVASIFSPLWMMSFVARAPWSPGILLRRLRLASWVAFALNASVHLYASQTLSVSWTFTGPFPGPIRWIARATSGS
jgi:hypothetical protein